MGADNVAIVRYRDWKVIDVATLDRIEPAFTPWTPSSTGLGTIDDADGEYVGRHRRESTRTLSVRRLFHVARHRRR